MSGRISEINFREIGIKIQKFSHKKMHFWMQNIVCKIWDILFRPQCVNLYVNSLWLWPTDIKLWSGLALAQLMACCLMAPIHCLNHEKLLDLKCHLTHWGRVTHKCVGKLTIIGPDNGLSPGRRQAVIRTNAGILLIGTLGTNFSEILGKIHTFSFKKMHLKNVVWKMC